MKYKNDWFRWRYDEEDFGVRKTPTSVFDIDIRPTVKTFATYKEELLNNAILVRDTFTEPLDLMFSGGGDSEVILRCYVDLKIPINVFIFRYENDYNAVDLWHAFRICKELNITPIVIDFNLQKFFENEAYDIWKKGLFLNAGRLPHMKMIEYSDNIPIMGEAEPLWAYHQEKWKYRFSEVDYSQSIYAKIIGRPAVLDWYQHSPEVILSYAGEEETKQLRSSIGTLNDFEKAKYKLINRLWPKIKIRTKRVGFEGTMAPGLNSSKPEFMLEFNKTYITFSNKNIFLTEDELFNRIILK